MKITFKDLKQNKFVIEAEPSETVRSPPQGTNLSHRQLIP
ncbi:DNA repair protein RAD23 protein [Pyrenophora tritici-repentis]|nr:DNA repair protein RAD23 protein [Pyrenophora tritici-repentis]